MFRPSRACRIRAERRAGELLKETKESGQRHKGHGDQKSESRHTTPKLPDFGITRDQSSKWQQLAARYELRAQALRDLMQTG